MPSIQLQLEQVLVTLLIRPQLLQLTTRPMRQQPLLVRLTLQPQRMIQATTQLQQQPPTRLLDSTVHMGKYTVKETISDCLCFYKEISSKSLEIEKNTSESHNLLKAQNSKDLPIVKSEFTSHLSIRYRNLHE